MGTPAPKCRSRVARGISTYVIDLFGPPEVDSVRSLGWRRLLRQSHLRFWSSLACNPSLHSEAVSSSFLSPRPRKSYLKDPIKTSTVPIVPRRPDGRVSASDGFPQ